MHATASQLQSASAWLQVREAKEEGGGDVAPIPVTVRQLEALVRISEALARMELATVVSEAHCLAAIQLFHASTLDAVRSGCSQAINLSDEQVRMPSSHCTALHRARIQRCRRQQADLTALCHMCGAGWRVCPRNC